MSFMAPTPPIAPPMRTADPRKPLPQAPPFSAPPAPMGPMDPMQMTRPAIPPLGNAGGAPPFQPPALRPVGTPGGPITAPPLSTPPGWPAPGAPQPAAPAPMMPHHPAVPERNIAAVKARKRAEAGGAPMQAAGTAAGVLGGPAERPRKFLSGGGGGEPMDRAAIQRKAMRVKGEYS